MPEQALKELQKSEFISFALLFGSYAEAKETSISDVDIGIFAANDPDLLELGLLSARLETILKRKVDILLLNALYKKKPLMAFEAVSKGRLLMCRDRDAFVEFKRNVFLSYIDTKPLFDKVRESFIKRLEGGRFGERNYARTA